MPGLISDVFQSDESGEDQQSSQQTTISGDGETGIAASPSVSIGMDGSYEGADGSTHEWSNDTTIGADVDVDAMFATTAGLSDDGSSEFS